ncbi:MAG: TRL-like family protein [Heliobacteriaceae bacterium]|jgi:hypothetical protein|nr:TRL-like family protein [Heliobacteriaceae bacterium]
MKKFLVLAAMIAATGLCANAEGVYGLIYDHATEPGGGSSEAAPAKSGCASCRSWWGLVATGECGIKDAMRNGDIEELAFYDTITKNILGVKKFTVKAYGE